MHLRILLLFCALFHTAGTASAASPQPPELSDLLASDRPAEVARGEAELENHRREIVAGLLKNLSSPDFKVRREAAQELGLVVSPWLRGRECGARFLQYTKFQAPRRPVERHPQTEGTEEMRQALQAAITSMTSPGAVPPGSNMMEAEFALRFLCETLGEIADDQTIDWALERLAGSDYEGHTEPLFSLISTYLGVVTISTDPLGICGNSTPGERARYQELQKTKLSTSLSKAKALWKEAKPLSGEQRIALAIREWRSRPSSGDREKRLFIEMEPLIRLGKPAVAQLRAEQGENFTLAANGYWEVAIAAITGSENPDLVRELLKPGPLQDQRLACEIIIAAGSDKWLAELKQIRSTAAWNAIVVCHRDEAIPILKEAGAKYHWQELELRKERGSPKGLRPYR